MIFIVEGADGSGKSTLINKLSRYGMVVKISKDVTRQTPIWRSLIKTSNDCGVNLIADRSLITDYVYRMSDGGCAKVCISDLINLYRNTQIIYCETETQFQDSILRGEDFVTNVELAKTISDNYKIVLKILEHEGITVVHYNWKTDDLNLLLKEVGLV